MKISFVPATSAFVMAALATGALGRAGAFPAPGRPSRPPGRVRHVTRAGIKYSRGDVEVDRQIGEGSFGIVYSGAIEARKTGTVVLKRPKLTVEGAAELQEVEAWMNDRVSRDARGACADFLGSFRVSPDESYLNQSEGVIAKEGLWLVWRYEGDKTLAQFMAQPDYPAGIAKTLLGREGNLRGDAAVELEVTQATLKQLFKNLNTVHRAGLVHRDIKPHNLVLTHGKTGDVASAESKFKLIDLGACACFRTGMNFAPDETIMDPKYAPPEEFLIPSDDAPDIRKLFGPVALAAGSAAWLKHKPDRFDMYSAGIVMMQLALPSLRTNSGLVTFNKSLKRVGYDLFLWRDANKGQLSRSKTAVLDAGDGAGWDLARQLLRPRAYDEDAEVAAAVARNKARKGKAGDDDDDDAATELFQKGERPSAEEALRHPFFAVDPAEVAAMVAKQQMGGRGKRAGGFFGGIGGIFGKGGAEEADARVSSAADAEASSGAEEETAPENVLADMLGLEKRISKQQDLIMKQSTTIMRLRETGAPSEQIEKEQKTLERMKIGLQGLLRSFSFSQVEARTTMVKAATEMQEIAEEAGLEPPPLEGFMQNIFGKKATSAAVGAADSVLDSILDVLKPSRAKTTAEASGAEAAPPAAPPPASGSGLPPPSDDRAKDPAELRKRMDDIKSEMVAVAEQMAEMERRLLEQQEDLERRQARLERETGAGAAEKGYLAEEADREGKALTTAAGKPILREDIQNIEETKREIEEALTRIDGMQQAQKDLIE
jgi:serine/threonine protein kinase